MLRVESGEGGEVGGVDGVDSVCEGGGDVGEQGVFLRVRRDGRRWGVFGRVRGWEGRVERRGEEIG